jgi:putative nucleotidyltransferase with HDIG domain
MRKRIPLERLTVGMYVAGLDMSWVETPFFRHRMLITKPDQIAKLKASGVRHVEIETEKGHDVGEAHEEASGPSSPDDLLSLEKPADQPAVDTTPASSTAPTSFEEEMETAKKVYRDAKNVVERAMHDVRMGREINLNTVSKVVDELADSVLRNVDALTSLSRLKSFDEYTFFHSVNTSVLALAMGRSLEMDRGTICLMGMGTLLHDVGKMKVPHSILNKPGALDNYEFEIMKQHTLRGAEILSRTTGLREEAMRPALEHHERVDGSGYPYGRKGHELTQFGRISSVVDIYDAITSDRCYHKAMPPYKALQFLFTLGQKGHLEPLMVQRFIKCVGVYPVGSCVGLNTGEVAIVTQIQHEQPLNPKVIIIKDAAGNVFVPPQAVDLNDQDHTPARSISLVLEPKEVGIDPTDYLGGMAA